jgi:hypothetical protein
MVDGSELDGVSPSMAGYAVAGKPFMHLREPFKGGNFKIWKFQMRLALQSAGLAP